MKRLSVLLLLSAIVPAVASAAAPTSAATDIGTLDAATVAKPFKSKETYSPGASWNYPRRVFWGDTHLHTSASMDAGAFGNRLGFEDAYRFARGEELTSSTGQRVKLSRPLDFLVIADHSDNMGFFPALFAGDPSMLADPTGKRWYDMVQAGGEEGVKAALEIIDQFSRGTFPQALQFLPGTPAYQSTWKQIIAAAEKYNEPGRFTAFIGYEWTSQVPPGNNLHRVVHLPRRRRQGDPDRAVHHLSAAGQHHARKTSGRCCRPTRTRPAAACSRSPHNGNLSNGLHVPVRGESGVGQAADARVRRRRAPAGSRSTR